MAERCDKPEVAEVMSAFRGSSGGTTVNEAQTTWATVIVSASRRLPGGDSP